MAIKKAEESHIYLVSEQVAEEKLLEFASSQRRTSIPKIEENEYNMILDKSDFETIVNSIKNPQYNENLSKALKRKLIFD
ncbi:MAG: hypothetical protein A2287_09185 [Candidatus Melainabacteria bacterium RIFOXYA12_FULL_32_12]|nr:MAG: hypothetical protein A2255_03225 [Candidatus Melainabacteria bacterium RIFOXYA2_FULL_32_9]OGI25314.1 MAG: hypothetical protein A2287_09185 [Candidatus Melainabacteria bacterium RIFOXYA12_FULL_32_12]